MCIAILTRVYVEQERRGSTSRNIMIMIVLWEICGSVSCSLKTIAALSIVIYFQKLAINYIVVIDKSEQ